MPVRLVHDADAGALKPEHEQVADLGDSTTVKVGGGSGGGGEMDERIAKLEGRFDAVIPTLATKADMGDLKAAIASAESGVVKWVGGSAIAILLALLMFYMNRAVPISTPTPQAPPQVIVVPVPQTTNPPASQSPQATKRGP